jgi:hypothetical protein
MEILNTDDLFARYLISELFKMKMENGRVEKASKSTTAVDNMAACLKIKFIEAIFVCISSVNLVYE